MGATAIFRGVLPRFTRHRPPSRLTVLAWAIGAVALTAAAMSFSLSHHAGVSARVELGTATAEATPLPENQPAGAAMIDPAQYRKPAPPPDGRPRVAIILRGLGLSKDLTAQAIAKLPPDVTLALTAYGRDLQKTSDAARASGHEVFLDIPVQASTNLGDDAGPQALLAALPAAQNTQRFNWSMARFVGYPGVVFDASPTLADKDIVGGLTKAPATKGLIWVHPKAAGFDGLPTAQIEIGLSVDSAPMPQSIDSALNRLEQMARQNGTALGLADAYPVTLDRLADWTQHLEEHGIALVPASALAVTPAS